LLGRSPKREAGRAGKVKISSSPNIFHHIQFSRTGFRAIIHTRITTYTVIGQSEEQPLVGRKIVINCGVNKNIPNCPAHHNFREYGCAELASWGWNPMLFTPPKSVSPVPINQKCVSLDCLYLSQDRHFNPDSCREIGDGAQRTQGRTVLHNGKSSSRIGLR